MNKKTSKKKELSQSFKILAKFQLLYWHFSFILYNFVFKKPYFFLNLTLVIWKMQPIFLTLFTY